MNASAEDLSDKSKAASDPSTVSVRRGAIIFIGAASRVHAGYLKPAADALSLGCSSIAVVTETWSADAARVVACLIASWGKDAVQVLVLERDPKWSIERLRQLPSMHVATIAKIYGAEYAKTSENILISLEKLLQFSLCAEAFPHATMFLGENEKAHYFLYRRFARKQNGGVYFSTLIPGLRGNRRMSSSRPNEAILLSDTNNIVTRKIAGALTTALTRENPKRVSSCNLLACLGHLIPQEHRASTESQCRAGLGCVECKTYVSAIVAKSILVNTN